jgi:hypothetical protein
VTSVEQQLTLACTLAANLAIIASKYHLVRAAPALCGCLTMPLQCGHALMARAAGSGSESTQDTVVLLQRQALLLDLLIHSKNWDQTCVMPLVAQLAAPEPLVAWLSAAVRTTLALSGPLQKIGVGLMCCMKSAAQPPAVADLLALIAQCPLFPHHGMLQTSRFCSNTLPALSTVYVFRKCFSLTPMHSSTATAYSAAWCSC